MSPERTDFIAKLREIEEQANSAKAEIATGLSSTRLQNIVVLAMILRGRLEFGLGAAASAASDVPEREVRSVTSEARIARHASPARRA